MDPTQDYFKLWIAAQAKSNAGYHLAPGGGGRLFHFKKTKFEDFTRLDLRLVYVFFPRVLCFLILGVNLPFEVEPKSSSGRSY